MLQGEHSAMLSTFIKLQFVIKIFILSFFFEWPFYIGFTVYISPDKLSSHSYYFSNCTENVSEVQVYYFELNAL